MKIKWLVKGNLGLDLFYVVAGRSMSAISAIGIAMVLARSTQSKTIGAYYFAFAAVNFFSMFSQLGLSQTIIKIAAKIRSESEEVLKISFANAAGSILCIVCVSAATIALLVGFFGGSALSHFSAVEEISAHLPSVCIWIFLFAIQLTVADIFRAMGKLNLFALFSGALSNTLMLMILVIFWVIRGVLGLVDVFVINNVAIAVSILVGLLFAREKGLVNLKSVLAATKLIKDFSWLSFHSLSAGLFSYLILQTNIWFIAWIGSAKDVANFALANRLVTTLALINAVISSSLSARVADACVRSDAKFRQKLATEICRISLGAALIPGLVLFIWADEILSIVYGTDYPLAAWMVRVLVCGYIAIAFFGMRNYFLMMFGGEAIQNSISAIAGIAHAFIVFGVMRIFGVPSGVAVSALLLASTATLEAFVLYKKKGILSTPLLFEKERAKRQ